MRNDNKRRDKRSKKGENFYLIRGKDKTGHSRYKLSERVKIGDVYFSTRKINQLIKSGQAKLKKEKNGAVSVSFQGWKVIMDKNRKKIITAYPESR